MTKKQIAAYLKSPYHCPFCSHGNIEALGYDGELQCQLVECEKCDKQWKEWFKMIDISEE